MTDQEARTLLERLITQRTAEAVHMTVSLAVEKWATELAREAMEEPEFRREWRELVREQTRLLLQALRQPVSTEGVRDAGDADDDGRFDANDRSDT